MSLEQMIALQQQLNVQIAAAQAQNPAQEAIPQPAQQEQAQIQPPLLTRELRPRGSIIYKK